MKRFKQIIALSLTALMGTACFVACGDPDAEAAGNRERITFWSVTDQYGADAYEAVVDAYNDGQGKLDNVYVKLSNKTDSSQNHMAFCKSGTGTVDVIGINDKFVFNNIAQGFYTDLQPYIDDTSTYTKNAEGETYFSVSNFTANNIDRFRFNVDTREAGEGEDLYALPLVSNACVLYYNETYFEEANINIISVPESELDAYNEANGTSFAARGYAEYTPAATPKAGLKTSKNLQGEEVVKVFNNLIPMSFLEVNTLAKFFTKAYRSESPSTYGVLNEWWFSHGWAVGGDCVKWDEASGQYKFTLNDQKPNYLVTGAVTVNGTAYAAGDILSYRDRNYVLSNPSSEDSAHLYELPSMYEQFREFCAWSQTKGLAVDSEFTGYGISPSPATLGNNSKITYFTSGNVAMFAEGANAMDTLYTSLVGKDKWNAALMYTYREFNDEDPSPDGTLEVIDGTTFTGEIKEQEGTPIVGKLSGSSINFGWAIPANSSHKDAAWKFLQYLTSAEGQSYFAANDSGIPTNSEYALSEEFYNKENKKCSNYRAISMMSEVCALGDWSYFEDGEWVNVWADKLNTDVRNGKTQLDAFFNEYEPKTNDVLKNYKFKLHGKD